MRKLYSRIGKKRFIISAIVIFIISDIISSFNLYSFFNDTSTFETVFQEMAEVSHEFQNLDKKMMDDLIRMTQFGGLVMMSLIIIFNLIMEVFLYFEKNFARIYFILLSFFAGGSAFLNISAEPLTSSIFSLAFLYCFIGLTLNPKSFETLELQNSSDLDESSQEELPSNKGV